MYPGLAPQILCEIIPQLWRRKDFACDTILSLMPYLLDACHSMLAVFGVVGA